MQRSFDEHQSIIDAIAAGDVEAAVNAVRHHVVVQGERFADLLSGLQQMTQAQQAESALGAAQSGA